MTEENNRHNVQINSTSPKEDILSAITGKWSSTIINGWKVIHITDRIELWQKMCSVAGSYMLPRKLNEVNMAKIFNTNGTVTCKPLLLQQSAISVDRPCMVEVLITNL